MFSLLVIMWFFVTVNASSLHISPILTQFNVWMRVGIGDRGGLDWKMSDPPLPPFREKSKITVYESCHFHPLRPPLKFKKSSLRLNASFVMQTMKWFECVICRMQGLDGASSEMPYEQTWPKDTDLKGVKGSIFVFDSTNLTEFSINLGKSS